MVDAQDRVRGEHPEVVRFAGLQPPLDPHRDGRIVHRRLRDVGGPRLDQQLQVRPLAEPLLEFAERDDREVVLRVAEERPLFLADAHDPEVQSRELDDLVERIFASEQLVRDVPADQRHRHVPFDLVGADESAALRVERREEEIVPRDALDLHRVDRLVLVLRLSPCVGLRGDGRDVLAVAAHRRPFGHLDLRVVPDALLVLLRPHDRHPLDGERGAPAGGHRLARCGTL